MVFVHLAEGFEEIEALMVVDVLRRANINVKMISVSNSQFVLGAHGIKVEADMVFEEADYNLCEMIVLPGGVPGTLNLKAHKGLESQIINFDKQGKWLAAICAAPMILGSLGLLKGKKATCYPGWEQHLAGVDLVDAPFIISDHFITGKGIGVADIFALEIVAVLKGDSVSKELGNKMLLRP